MLQFSPPRGGLQPVYTRHTPIHQDQVEGLGLESRNHVGTVGLNVGIVTETLQHECYDLLTDGVVISHEHVERVTAASR